MARQLKIILKNQPVGRSSTPWLDPYRESFAKAAKEVADELKDSKLKGVARVRAFNARVSQKLKGEG